MRLFQNERQNIAQDMTFQQVKQLRFNPDEIKMVSTGLAVQLGDDEVLKLYDRSSNPVKRGIALINSVGIIDSDYYPQEFKGLFMNISKEPVTISKGQRIMQGVFVNTLQQTMTTQMESVQAVLVALGRV
jgi:deoxyuridine 5'-triphosphate nucleotidohydrolase